MSPPNEPLEEETTCDLGYAGYFACATIAMGLLATIVMYYVYAILGLIDTSRHEIRHVCHASNLWIYVLVSLILSPLTGGSGANEDHHQNSANGWNATSVFSMPVQLFFIVWGPFELFSPCVKDHFRNTILYNVALAFWIWSIVGFVLITALTCGLAAKRPPPPQTFRV